MTGDALAGRLLAVLEAEHQSGSRVAGQDDARRRETVTTATRRWRSFRRRSAHPDLATGAERVEDLAKGLRDHCEVTPALTGPLTLTGPLMRDYRSLAARLAEVLADHQAEQ